MSSESSSFVPITELLKPVLGEEISILEDYLDNTRPVLQALRADRALFALPQTQEIRAQRRELIKFIQETSHGEYTPIVSTLIQFSDSKVEYVHGGDFSDKKGEVKGFIVLLSRSYSIGAQVIILDDGLSRAAFDRASEEEKKKMAISVYKVNPFKSLAFVTDEGRDTGYKVETLFKIS